MMALNKKTLFISFLLSIIFVGNVSIVDMSSCAGYYRMPFIWFRIGVAYSITIYIIPLIINILFFMTIFYHLLKKYKISNYFFIPLFLGSFLTIVYILFTFSFRNGDIHLLSHIDDEIKGYSFRIYEISNDVGVGEP